MSSHYNIPVFNDTQDFESETCEYDGKLYPSGFIKKGEFIPSLDRYQRVFVGNLKEYLETIKNIAV